MNSPRLTPAEEAALGVLALNGDRDARDRLVNSMVGFAYKLAGRPGWLVDGIERDDLRQEALLAVIVAAERFDPTGHPGIRFSTFAGCLILGRLKTYCQKNRRRELTGFEMDQFPDPATLPASLDKRHADAMLAVIERLNPKQRELLELHYGLGDRCPMTFKEIGAELKVSKQAVHQKVVACLERLGQAVQKAA